MMTELANSSSRTIAADIGGTKSWMCLYEYLSDDPSNITLNSTNVLHEQIYSSTDFSDFPALLNQFLKDCEVAGAINTNNTDNGNIDTMCLALPGVIKHGKSNLTNLDWQLDEQVLQQKFTINHVHFVNDFQAAALGVTTLEEEDIITLNPLSPLFNNPRNRSETPHKRTQTKGITVVTGAGTGLGLAWMDTSQKPVQLFSSEGGHCDFAPTNSEQIELLTFFLKQYSHVSYERILSGAGLVQLYRFLNPDYFDRETEIETTETTLMTQKINHLAKQGDFFASSTMRLFVEIYGAYIGNLALLYKPVGGIYIAGGIATHILEWMQGNEFIEYYLHKGRMRHLAENTPIYLVKNNRLGLQGAMQFAINKISSH